jgi:putative transposase
MQRALGTSERKACQTVGQARSTQRYQPQKRSGDDVLVKRMLELSGKHPRYGYRRVWSLLEREGFRVNLKRVHRLWREHGLKVPQRRRKKRATGQGSNGCAVKRVEYKNHVWWRPLGSQPPPEGKQAFPFIVATSARLSIVSHPVIH